MKTPITDNMLYKSNLDKIFFQNSNPKTSIIMTNLNKLYYYIESLKFSLSEKLNLICYAPSARGIIEFNAWTNNLDNLFKQAHSESDNLSIRDCPFQACIESTIRHRNQNTINQLISLNVSKQKIKAFDVNIS